jgi:hypothetical protein
MFINPLTNRLFVSKTMFFPLIIVFLMAAVYFGLEVLEIISAEVYEGRYGSISFLHEDPWGYWGGVFKYSSFSVAFIYLSLIIRRKKLEE